MSDATTTFKSLLHEMTQTTATCLWNDSCSLEELAYATEHGGVGATCNPVIVVEVLKKEMRLWRARIEALVAETPTATEQEVAWRLVEEMSVKGAEVLRPVFDVQRGRNGRLSVQTDPRYFRDAGAILRQAERFAASRRTFLSKSRSPPRASSHRGSNLPRHQHQRHRMFFAARSVLRWPRRWNAASRGVSRKEDIETMGTVCTIMVGRLDDWLKVVADKQDISVDPGVLEWAGLAVFKKAYGLFRERRYRLRLLSAAFRNHMHWSELIGGDVVISPPHAWQKRFNACDVAVESRIDKPIAPEILSALNKFADFRRASTEQGLSREEFDSFPPTRRTLRQFITACHELDGQIRELMLPNPDGERL